MKYDDLEKRLEKLEQDVIPPLADLTIVRKLITGDDKNGTILNRRTIKIPLTKNRK